MKISFEIDESANEGKGKVSVSYKVGQVSWNEENILTDDTLTVFTRILGILKTYLHEPRQNHTKNLLCRLAEANGIEVREVSK